MNDNKAMKSGKRACEFRDHIYNYFCENKIMYGQGLSLLCSVTMETLIRSLDKNASRQDIEDLWDKLNMGIKKDLYRMYMKFNEVEKKGESL